MVQPAAVPSQSKLRVLAADSTAMTTQLLVDALERNGQFEMIECPSDMQSLVALVHREKPAVAVVSAQLEEPKD